MSALEQAIEDVSAAISAKVNATPAARLFKDVGVEELHKLGQALSWMKFGQQGMTVYRYTGSYDQTYRSDQHETHHEGVKRSQVPAGFRDGSDG